MGKKNTSNRAFNGAPIQYHKKTQSEVAAELVDELKKQLGLDEDRDNRFESGKAIYNDIKDVLRNFFEKGKSFEEVNEHLSKYNLKLKKIKHVEADRVMTSVMRNLFNGTIKEVHSSVAKEQLSEVFYKYYEQKMKANKLRWRIKETPNYDLGQSEVWQKCRQFGEYANLEWCLQKGLKYFGVKQNQIKDLNIEDIHQILLSQLNVSTDKVSGCAQYKIISGGAKTNNTKRFIRENEEAFRKSLHEIKWTTNYSRVRDIVQEEDALEQIKKIKKVSDIYDKWVETLVFGMKEYGSTDIMSIAARFERENIKLVELPKKIREGQDKGFNVSRWQEELKDVQDRFARIEQNGGYKGLASAKEFEKEKHEMYFPKINVHHKNPNKRCLLMQEEGRPITDNNAYENMCFVVEGVYKYKSTVEEMIAKGEVISEKVKEKNMVVGGTHDFMHVVDDLENAANIFRVKEGGNFDYVIEPKDQNVICMLRSDEYFVAAVNESSHKQVKVGEKNTTSGKINKYFEQLNNIKGK